jgi:hypothetical protein
VPHGGEVLQGVDVFCQATLPEFNHFRGRESFSI